MNSAVIEIIPIEPCESKVVIVPLFEQSIESQPRHRPNRTLSPGFVSLRCGKGGGLLSVLEENGVLYRSLQS